MTMLLLIFRQWLEQDLHQLLADLEVKAFTQDSRNRGGGKHVSFMSLAGA